MTLEPRGARAFCASIRLCKGFTGETILESNIPHKAYCNMCSKTEKADVIADALTAEHLSYYGDRGSKTVKVY